jgi:hypothetical protein
VPDPLIRKGRDFSRSVFVFSHRVLHSIRGVCPIRRFREWGIFSYLSSEGSLQFQRPEVDSNPTQEPST